MVSYGFELAIPHAKTQRSPQLTGQVLKMMKFKVNSTRIVIKSHLSCDFVYHVLFIIILS